MRAAMVLAAWLLAASPALAKPMEVRLGEIRQVTLDATGQATLKVRLKTPGVLEADVFAAPDAVGDIILEVLDDKGLPRLAGAPAGPGAVTVRVKAANPVAGGMQLRLRADPSVDGFEPNDSRAAARAAKPPFTGWIETGPGDQDWFRVEASEGVIGISLEPAPYGKVVVLDASGKPVPDSPKDGVIGSGITYIATRGKPLYLVISGPESGGRTISRLSVTRYAAAGANDGAVVTVGLADDQQSAEQLALAARAAGARAVAADDADAIGATLSDALEPTSAKAGGKVWWIVGGLAALLAAAGGGYWVWRRRKAPAAATPATEPPPEPLPDA